MVYLAPTTEGEPMAIIPSLRPFYPPNRLHHRRRIDVIKLDPGGECVAPTVSPPPCFPALPCLPFAPARPNREPKFTRESGTRPDVIVVSIVQTRTSPCALSEFRQAFDRNAELAAHSHDAGQFARGRAMVDGGVPMAMASKMMGHKDIRTTQGHY